jgi:hypothetical protein
MTSTDKKPKKKPAPAPEPETPPAVDKPAPQDPAAAAENLKHQEVIDLVKGNCLEVHFKISKLPKSRKISGALADAIASAVKGKKKSVRGSWMPYAAEHPAVKEFNAKVREIEMLRDGWTLVKSAEVKAGPDGGASIEGGKRLIWEHDHEQFYKLASAKAREITLAAIRVQKYLDADMYDDSGKRVPSIKEMGKSNAGDAWEESVYPPNLADRIGIPRERNPDGSYRLDEDGQYIYLIEFDEYHVSEKLSDTLRKRAVERLDARMSETVEKALTYAVGALTEDLETFMNSLVSRTKIKPVIDHPWSKYTLVDKAEVIKVRDTKDDPDIPAGMIKVYLSFKEVVFEKDEATGKKKAVKDKAGRDKIRTVKVWEGPITVEEYETKVRPQIVTERKPIHTSVLERIVENMESFRDKKAKMLGSYGKEATEKLDGLLAQLTKYQKAWVNPEDALAKLAKTLKNSKDEREALVGRIADTITDLDEYAEHVKKVARRRSIGTDLFGDEEQA